MHGWVHFQLYAPSVVLPRRVGPPPSKLNPFALGHLFGVSASLLLCRGVRKITNPLIWHRAASSSIFVGGSVITMTVIWVGPGPGWSRSGPGPGWSRSGLVRVRVRVGPGPGWSRSGFSFAAPPFPPGAAVACHFFVMESYLPLLRRAVRKCGHRWVALARRPSSIFVGGLEKR